AVEELSPRCQTGSMRIAFLGPGRLGTELALHLLSDHQLTVWNRTREKTSRLAEAGASVADSPAEAVTGAEVVISSLFGPPAVRETITGPELIPDGVPWLDATTVSPADAEEFAAAVPGYVGVPVVGSLGPARQGRLGVYVGTPDARLRELTKEMVAPWAVQLRLRVVGCGIRPRSVWRPWPSHMACAGWARGGMRPPASCWRTWRWPSAPRVCGRPWRWAMRSEPRARRSWTCWGRPGWTSSPG